MGAKPIEVYCFQEVISSLDCTVKAIPKFAAHRTPVHRVQDFVDLSTQKCSKAFPVCIHKCFLQLISEITYGGINRHFLKHGTVVRCATSTAAPRLRIVRHHVQFIKTKDGLLQFFCRTGRLPSRLSKRSRNLLRNGCGTLTSKPCKQHIDKVQQFNNLTNHKVDCRGKCIDDRSRHSAQAILEILTAGSQPVHTLCESTSHKGTILIEVVDTVLHGLRQLREHETNSTIHSNSLHAAKQFAKTRCVLLNLCSQRRTQHIFDFPQHITGFRSSYFYFCQSISQFMKRTSTQREPLREHTPDTTQDGLEYIGLFSDLLHRMSGFLGAACSLFRSARFRLNTCRGNTSGRNCYLRKSDISNILQISQCLA